MRLSLPHLRLSGTSFLLHESYVPAVRFTARLCDDVALLLAETGERGEYLPSIKEINEIKQIIDGEGATLHVHLPTDADCGTPQRARLLVRKVRQAVERAAPLAPHSFVLHLDFPSLCGTGCRPSRDQQAWTREALHDIAACLPSPEQLAVENLEGFPSDFWDGWLDGSSFSRCLDIGHFWKDGRDPAAVLEGWLASTRVIHLHGLAPRGESGAGREEGLLGHTELGLRFGPRPKDHVSLALMPEPCVDAVMHPLWRSGFSGVLNLEVFSAAAFTESHAVLMRSWERFAATSSGLPSAAVPASGFQPRG